MIKVLSAIGVMALGIAYYLIFYPPVVMKRAARSALQQFSDSVESKDRSKISASLQNVLSDDATVKLEVNFFSLTGNVPPMVQDFNKQTFIAFIDNTLYPLTDYAYYPELTSFKLNDDRQSAQVTFKSKEWADGANYYGGTAVNMRFSSDTACEGKAVFAGNIARLSQVTCKMQFRAVPKPQEIEKLQNMESMRDFIGKQR